MLKIKGLGNLGNVTEGLENSLVSWGQVSPHPEKKDLVVLEIGQYSDTEFTLIQGVCTHKDADKKMEGYLHLLLGLEEEPAPGTDQKVAPAAHRKGFCDLCGDELPPGPGASMKHRAQAHPKEHRALAQKGAETTKKVGQVHKKVTKALARPKKRK